MDPSIEEVNKNRSDEKKMSSVDEKDVDVVSLRRGASGLDTSKEHAHRRLEPRCVSLLLFIPWFKFYLFSPPILGEPTQGGESLELGEGAAKRPPYLDLFRH